MDWPEPAPFLDGLPPEAAGDLVQAGTPVTRKAGTNLFFEGDDGDSVLIIQSGSVKVTASAPDGQEIVLCVLGAGDTLGELSAFDRAPRSAAATVLTECEILVVPRARFVEVTDRHPSILRKLLTELTTRVRSTSARQLEFGTADAMTRVCRRLHELAGRYGRSHPDGTVTIKSPLNQTDLGAWSALSRDSVVRALAGLRELGWIDNRASRMTLLDPDAIRRRAEL